MTTPFPFVSAAVLTAAQMNAITTLVTSTKTASHTLTIADVSTRVIMNSASATTITVNTSIFGASDVVEILNIGAGVCTVTAGTCTVGTSGTLALVQNAGGTLTFISASASVFRATGVTAAVAASGFTLVSATTIGNAVSSVTVSSAFSATYDAYKIIISGGSSSADQDLAMILGATVSGYKSQLVYGAFANTPLAVGAGSLSSFLRAGRGNQTTLQMNLDIVNPFLTELTYFTSMTVAAGYAGLVNGFLDNTTSYTAFTLTPDTGTLTGGTIRVYGYANS